MFAIAGRMQTDVKEAAAGEAPKVPSKHAPERDV